MSSRLSILYLTIKNKIKKLFNIVQVSAGQDWRSTHPKWQTGAVATFSLFFHYFLFFYFVETVVRENGGRL
jgi:hypothetical protein